MSHEHRLIYVDGSFAWFCTDPLNAWGDDWNDAPHDCNAGDPYPDRGGDWIKVAYDGGLDIVGVDDHDRWGYLSVKDIRDGQGPWLVELMYGQRDVAGRIQVGVSIPALVTLAEFRALVAQAGGDIYVPVDAIDRLLVDAGNDLAEYVNTRMIVREIRRRLNGVER